MSGTLYVVGTPIGNLGDFSPRALQTLEHCDFIAAEDTRVTLKLLNHFGLKKPMVSYYEHNRRERGSEILSRILAGENCAVVTDAGMPAISDPGEDLVRLCHMHGVPVSAVPGPCAFAAALAISGMPSGRFTFEGFLSVSRRSRNAHLESLKTETRTMLFYEAPHKLLATLRDMYASFGEREIAIVREITKVYEEVVRTTFSEAIARCEAQPFKGEIVLIVSGAPQPVPDAVSPEDAAEEAAALVEGGLSPTEAAKQIAKAYGMKKGDIYKYLTQKAESV